MTQLLIETNAHHGGQQISETRIFMLTSVGPYADRVSAIFAGFRIACYTRKVYLRGLAF